MRLLLPVAVLLIAALTVLLLFRLGTEPSQRWQRGAPAAPSAAPDGIVMPDLRGLAYPEALSRLADANLSLRRKVTAQGEPGVVVATDPSLGQLVPEGTRVTIYVGSAPDSPESATALVSTESRSAEPSDPNR